MTGTTLLRKLFERSPPCKDCEELLPLSEKPRRPKAHATGGSETGTYRKPSGAESKDGDKYDIKTSCVQICPHETLSFERMKRIVCLPHFKYSRDKIGALTKIPGHHHVSSAEGTYRCTPYPKAFGSLKAKGFYKYQLGYEGSYDGLVLCVDWTMNFDKHMDLAGGCVSDLQRFLDPLDIQLCRHTKIGDARIASKLYGFCNPSRAAGDPVEAYEEVHRSRRTDRCTRCHTTFETYKEGKSCHILVKRYLGKGTSAYESRWLAQSGEGKHRLRSFGAAALQSCKDLAGM